MKNKIPLFVWIIASLSFLIVAAFIAYYLVVILPNKDKNNTQVNTPINPSINASSPSPTPKQAAQKPSTLSLLNQCLDAAKAERNRINEELLKLSDQGETITKSAFDSNEELFLQEREECFMKYPQD